MGWSKNVKEIKNNTINVKGDYTFIGKDINKNSYIEILVENGVEDPYIEVHKLDEKGVNLTKFKVDSGQPYYIVSGAGANRNRLMENGYFYRMNSSENGLQVIKWMLAR